MLMGLGWCAHAALSYRVFFSDIFDLSISFGGSRGGGDCKYVKWRGAELVHSAPNKQHHLYLTEPTIP